MPSEFFISSVRKWKMTREINLAFFPPALLFGCDFGVYYVWEFVIGNDRKNHKWQVLQRVLLSRGLVMWREDLINFSVEFKLDFWLR